MGTGFYTTYRGERVLAVIKINATFLLLRIYCEKICTSAVLNRAMRCLNTDKLLTNKVSTIYKMQKILQLKDIYNLEVSKFMYKYTT